LRDSAADQQRGTRGQTGDQGRGGKHEQAEQYHAAGAEEIGRPPAEKHQAAEHQGVGTDDPGQCVAFQAEVRADVRQRDRHHGDIQDEHELRDAEQCQHAPAAWVDGEGVGLVDGLSGHKMAPNSNSCV
jgi:hypothetical protein